MTKDEMLDAISKLQATALMVAQDKDDAYGMYWQTADLGWALMQATGIAAVTREEFEQKQEELFDIGWRMVRQPGVTKDKWMTKYLADYWPEVLE